MKHLRLQFRSSSAAFVDVVEQGFDIESDSLGFDEALKVVEDLVVVGLSRHTFDSIAEPLFWPVLL